MMSPTTPIRLSPNTKSVLPNGYLAVWASVKLIKSYNGPAIKVQRQSDNAQQDISFINGILDTATINSFGNATTLRIVTFYDQSGNALDVTISNAAAPELYFDAYTNSYCIDFSAVTSSIFNMPSGVVVNTQNCSLYASMVGKWSQSQTFFDFLPSSPNSVLRYSESAFDRDAISDSSGVQHSNTNRYVAFSTDFDVIGVRCGPSNPAVRSNINNVAKTTVFSTPLTNNNTAGGTIGRATSYITGFANAFVIYNSLLSDADDTTVVSTLMQIAGNTTSKTKIVINTGDSISNGSLASKWFKSWFMLLYRAKNEPALNFVNTGINGETITGLTTNVAIRVTNLKNQAPGAYTSAVCILLVGTNDIQASVSGATAFANYKSLAQTIMAAGIKVIAVNIMVRPAFDSTKETERQSYNTLWRADMTYASAYFDVDALITSGDISSDQVHPNDGGHSKIANALLPILNSVL